MSEPTDTQPARGKRYSQFFRSAGNMVQRGRLEEAIGVLERGAALAREQGDGDFAAVFEAQAAEHRRELGPSAAADREGGALSITGTLATKAFKEWAVVCEALAAGRQVLLLRKGGIHEAKGRFPTEFRRFFLQPTYEHQNTGELKAEAHAELARLAARAPAPNRIRIDGYATVEAVIVARDREQLARLEGQHVWSPSYIDMRLEWKPERPLYLMLLRYYRTSEPLELPLRKAYGGCRSFIDLDAEDVPAELAARLARSLVPALGDAAFRARVDRILDLAR